MSESRTLRVAKAAKKLALLAYASEYGGVADASRLPHAMTQLEKAMAEWRGDSE